MIITPEHRKQLDCIAVKENIDARALETGFESGHIVYLKNRTRNTDPLAIGSGLPTRVNVNLGTSADMDCMDLEISKLELSEKYGADTVMDLSTGGNIRKVRRRLLELSRIPLGTVPVYQVSAEARERFGSFSAVPAEAMLEYVHEQAVEGVDFMTIHAGISREMVCSLRENERRLGIVSRGGSLLARWMMENREENPFLQNFDKLMGIMREYNVVLSLGDALRPGCIADATDRAQLSELSLLGELSLRARKSGVQVIIEGPGHVPLSEIKSNVMLEKKLCHGAPFYVLGPLPLDIAAGYDHIASAIGGAEAAAAGADFLCYVTPSEHLRLPDLDDVREGLMASRIAAHIGDIEKKVPGAFRRNLEMAEARAAFNWEGQKEKSIDPDKFSRMRKSVSLADSDTCSMCGDMCALKNSRSAMKN